MKSLLVAGLTALQFLTVFPPLVRRPATLAELGGAVGFFPLVGLLIGLLLAALHWLLGHIFPSTIGAALLLTAWILCTGALHFDGFLDSCDGLLGGHTVEARLRILRDEHVGAFAVAGGVLLLLGKYAALLALHDPLAALIVAPTLGRWAMSMAVVGYPYARAEGLGRALKDQAGWPQAVGATLLAGTIALLFAGWTGGAALVVVALGAWLLVRFVLNRIPGLTGDIYGTLCELGELLGLLVFAARWTP